MLDEDYGLKFTPIDSKKCQISGGEFDPTKVAETVTQNMKIGVQAGLSEAEATYIADFYGMNSLKIFEYAKEMEPYEGLTLAESAKLRYALEDEMVLTPVDYLLRRTNHILFMIEGVDKIKGPVINVMNHFLGWSPSEKVRQQELLEKALRESALLDLKGL